MGTLKPEQNERLFRALSDATRQRIVQLLIIEELNVSELVELLRQPQSTISRHLKVLRAASLIVDRRDGVTTFYRVRQGTTDAKELGALVLNWFRDHPLPRPLRDRLTRVLRGRKDAPGGFFERLGKRWDDLRKAAFGEVFATEAFVSLLPAEWTVADIGTGTGYLLPMLADNFARVIAVDPAATMLECARQRVNDHSAANVEFHQGDLSRLPITDQACGLAIALLVLHHVARPAEALAELRRVVRPGGRLLLVEQQSHENQKFYETMQDHWWGFDANDLAGQVRAAGFGAVRHHPLGSASNSAKSLEAPSLFVITGERTKD